MNVWGFEIFCDKDIINSCDFIASFGVKEVQKFVANSCTPEFQILRTSIIHPSHLNMNPIESWASLSAVPRFGRFPVHHYLNAFEYSACPEPKTDPRVSIIVCLRTKGFRSKAYKLNGRHLGIRKVVNYSMKTLVSYNYCSLKLSYLRYKQGGHYNLFWPVMIITFRKKRLDPNGETLHQFGIIRPSVKMMENLVHRGSEMLWGNDGSEGTEDLEKVIQSQTGPRDLSICPYSFPIAANPPQEPILLPAAHSHVTVAHILFAI